MVVTSSFLISDIFSVDLFEVAKSQAGGFYVARLVPTRKRRRVKAKDQRQNFNEQLKV